MVAVLASALAVMLFTETLWTTQVAPSGVCVCTFSALDERLRQLVAGGNIVSGGSPPPRSDRLLVDRLTAQQENNQLALMRLQQQMHAPNQSRCDSVSVSTLL